MKNLVLMAATAMVVLAFLLFGDQLQKLFTGRKPGSGAELPAADSYMRTTRTQVFDEQGRLSYSLTADQSEYYEAREQMLMTRPRLVSQSTQTAAEPWYLKADTGVLHNADRRVELMGNVVVWRNGSQGRDELRTSKLEYLPDDNRVRTERAVTLLSDNSITDAVGLDGDLELQNYRLLSQVRTIHQPR